jgi:Mrp family chromosome partitioning ATPase
MLDQTVRDTTAVEHVFGFSPAGLVLERRSFTKDFATEHFLRLISGIERARQNFQARTFVFASLKPGGGTTRLVEDIARELKSQGVRVLKIEANAYRPDPRYSSSSQTPGLADILSGKCRPHEAIQHGGSLAPDWIHIGNTKGRPRLPGCHRLGPVLDQLASEYDVVLVDAAPLLLSSDTEAIVGLASATMLVVRANSDNVKDLKRANSLLRRLEPGAVGCVLNRVELNRAGEGLQQEFADYSEFRRLARSPEESAVANVPELDDQLTDNPQKLLARQKEDGVS